jgi:hypothetical protein
MKALLLAFLGLCAQEQRREADFFDRVEFGATNPDADEERKVLEVLSKREHWIGAFRTIERTFGAFPDNLVVKVDFSLKGPEAGWGAGRGSEGKIRFNLNVLGNIQRKINEIEEKSKEAQARGGKVVYKVPPAKIERVIYHELTHVLQREYMAPGWFTEGMATFVADDPNNLYGFAVANKPIEEIDAALTDPHDSYARGHLFWKWIETRSAVKKVAELALVEHKVWKDALEEGTGFPWAVLVITERKWSAAEIQKYKVK